MTREITGQIKARVTTRALCARVGLCLDRGGGGLCPFHEDRRTPSLKVYADPARGWHCFGCGAGGSVIDFAMRWYGLNFRQAVVRLDADFGLGLPLTAKPAARDRRLAAERERLAALARERARRAGREAEAAYWTCFERYLACARRMDAHRPRRGEDLPIQYAAAARLLAEIRDEYERALDALEEARLHGGGQPAGGPDAAMDARRLPFHRAV